MMIRACIACAACTGGRDTHRAGQDWPVSARQEGPAGQEEQAVESGDRGETPQAGECRNEGHPATG